jgi:serine/threonine protein kinase/CubicO group peptidase (beta-lactamase class C family)
METHPIIHPSADVLQAFALGKLNDTTASVVMNHLDSCSDCCKLVAAQSGDDFLHRLRQVHDGGSTPALAKALADGPRRPEPPASQTAIPNLPPELAANQQYDILRELGRGGMGVVYLAKNKPMDRLEVLKVINTAMLDHPDAVERFLREIRSAAKLSHANVVTAYSVLQLGGLLAFAMEYIEGQDLASLVKSRGPLPIVHACYYVQQAAGGLQHAFEKQMVHRDIKPQNLILAREGKKHIVKVLDFGLAKVMREKSEDTGLTSEGRMMGTPDYIAPEQALDAARADIRADIYSLGCTLYYLLAGRPPFSGSSLSAILLAHQMEEARPLNLVRPEVAEELAAVVRKMMAKTPGKRYQTPLEVVQALAPFVKQGATPKPSPEPSLGAAKAAVATPVKAESAAPAITPAKQPPAVSEPPNRVARETMAERKITSAQPGRRGAVRKRHSVSVMTETRKKWLMGGGIGVGVLLVAFLGMWANGVFKVKTPEGTIVIELDSFPADAEVLVDGANVSVKWDAGGKTAEIGVPPGKHQIDVKMGNITVKGKEVDIQTGERQLMRVSFQQESDEERWIREVRALPAKEQLEKVKAKLKEHNPGFDDWSKEPTIENGVVTGLEFVTDQVTDINPLRALPKLTFLSCKGSGPEKGKLTDLSPLKAIHLTGLKCNFNKRLSDLSPLKDMKLTSVYCMGTSVLDLSPLKGMPLTILDCWVTPVSDLSPLKDMKLTDLQFWFTQVSDLSPLKGMPLPILGFTGTRVSDLSPLKGMPLTCLNCDRTPVSDLSPLKGMPLTYLNCDRTPVSDLSPLKGMPLVELYCDGTKVNDLSPLKGMTLKKLGCPFRPERDTEILRSIKTLETINGKPAAQFWKEVDGQKRDPIAAPPRTPPVAADGFVPLFNRKDLTGWKTHPKEPRDWHVKNGVLISGEKPSYLFSEGGDYENFRLRIEARINQKGNSGLFFRTRFEPGVPHGYEAEIVSPSIRQEKTGTLFERDSAEIYHSVVRDGSLMAADQWFTMEIIAEGDHIVIWVNDTKTADCRVNNRQFPRGHFALQKDNRDTRVEFRKIEIKELPAAHANTPTTDLPDPLPTTGRIDPRLKSFDQLMTGFLKDHKVPGAALAVARNGRLVYSRGFGLADLATKEPVQPRALFRISAISTSITAVAVLQLVERRRLKLDDPVFDVLKLQEPQEPGVQFDPRWKKVTILHLLQQRGGWDRDKSFDPLFRSPAIVKELGIQPPADPDSIIRYMIRRPLDLDPGARDVFCNFNYCLLGRVIEKISGQSYEDYVRKNVLAPLGIRDMRLGATLMEKRAPGEVKYHVAKDTTAPAVMGPHLGEAVPLPYGTWCLESMDASAGWLASAPDLVRFVSAFDHPQHCKILKAKSIEVMFARPPRASGLLPLGRPRDLYYSCGWLVRPIGNAGLSNVFNNGYLDGASALLVRRHDGLAWAVLFNSHQSIQNVVPSGKIDPLVHEAADAVKTWPY